MASSAATLRQSLSASGLCSLIRRSFADINDTRRQASIEFSLPDVLMSAFAMFQFKVPSLLQFDQRARDENEATMIGNLKRLYDLERVPSDSQMRHIIDPISPESLRPAFRAVHSAIQRGKRLDSFKVLDNALVVSVDGTGLFSSTKVHCAQCGVKKRSNGSVEYYHQMLVAAIVSPAHKTALPIDFEPIVKSDGASKDCCEHNAAKRLIPSLARQYAKRQLIITADALAANGPYVKLLIEHGMDFVLGVKPVGNAKLFKAFDQRWQALASDQPVIEFEQVDPDSGLLQGCRFSNDLPLNDSNADVRVNLIEFWEVDKKGRERNWSWISSMAINRDNALAIAAIGRSRWRIENETFNTLKNQGYHFEHNYGHGKKYLSSTLAGLMLLAFLCDQVQEFACQPYKAARAKARTKAALWSQMQAHLYTVELPGWESLIQLIGGLGPKLVIVTTDDSG